MPELTIQQFAKNAPDAIKQAIVARKGLAHRKAMNLFMRLKGEPALPGPYAGARNWRRYHSGGNPAVTIRKAP
jgi:hypothetical protein